MTAASDSRRSDARLSKPMALLFGSAVLALVFGLLLALSGDNGFGVFLASVVGFAAATLWLVGCIAMGVRVGRDTE